MTGFLLAYFDESFEELYWIFTFIFFYYIFTSDFGADDLFF